MPAPHCSVFTGRMPFLPPNQQRRSTEVLQTCYLLLHRSTCISQHLQLHCLRTLTQDTRMHVCSSTNMSQINIDNQRTHTHTCTCLTAIFPGCITHHRNNWPSRLPVTHCTGNSASKIMTLRRYTNLFITISIKMLHNVTRVETNNSWQFLKKTPLTFCAYHWPVVHINKAKLQSQKSQEFVNTDCP